MYVYKIQTDIKNIEELIKVLSKDYDILYYYNLYLSPKKERKNEETYLKKALNKIGKCIIIKIDENNLKAENDKIISWCVDKFVERDLKKYERDHQNQYIQYLEYIQYLMNLFNSKGGDTNGKKE